MVLRHKGDLARATESLINQMSEAKVVDFDGRTYVLEAMDTLSKLELLMGLSVSRRIHIPLFASIIADCDMTWNDLYRQYIGKNVLNFFRQDHGYKQGTYRKLWNGTEDNEHLVGIMADLDANAADFQDQLYQHLDKRYKETA